MGTEDGRLVGHIEPDPDGDRPAFRIVRRTDKDAGPGVRPCNHPEFVLDERWSTVTCGKCGERVDPFAALMHYADWWERMERHRHVVRMAERKLIVQSLKSLKRMRYVTDEERAQIEDVLRRSSGAGFELEDLRELERRIAEGVRERRRLRKRGPGKADET